jgi:hypothetical protein
MPALILVLIVVSFAVGFLRTRWWTVFVCPAIWLIVGVSSVINEPPNFDMHDVGLYFGVLMAVVCIIGWICGRLIALAVRGGRNQDSG